MKNLIGSFLASDVTIPDINDPNTWIADWAFGRKTPSGERVTPNRAMSLSVYYGCIRNISEDMAKLPLDVFKKIPRGKTLLNNHVVSKLMNVAPNDEMTPISYRTTASAHVMASGNTYAEIERAGNEPVALHPIHYSRVQVKRRNGVMYYEVKNNDGSVTNIDPWHMFHVPGLSVDGIVGYSMLKVQAESLGLGIALQTFAAAFFGNGSTMGGVLEHPAKLGDEAAKRLRESWQTMHQGAARAHKTAILEEGMKYNAIGIPPNEAQFIESRQFAIEEICRWFRMPPHKVQNLLRSTNNNIEHQGLEYVGDTVSPWCKRFEQEIKRKLILEDDVFCAHDMKELELKDAAARANYYKTMQNLGALSPNEIREAEGMNPIDGEEGDEYYIQMNMTTLEAVSEGAVEPTPDPDDPPALDAPPVKPQLPSPKQEPAKAEVKTLDEFRDLFLDASNRILDRETKIFHNKAPKFFGRQAAFDAEVEKCNGQTIKFIIDDFSALTRLASWHLGTNTGHALLRLEMKARRFVEGDLSKFRRAQFAAAEVGDPATVRPLADLKILSNILTERLMKIGEE